MNVIPFPAQGMAARSDETPREVRPVGQQPGREAMRPDPFDNPILRAIDQLQAAQDHRIREMFNG